MATTICARKAELKILDKLYASNKAELIAVYGRRRIGKTYLISEYFKNKGYYFELTGTKDADIKTQLNNFREEFADSFEAGIKQATPENWQTAFDQLRRKVQQLDSDKKIILFFDELPWLASRHSGVLQALEHVWNRYLSRMNNIIVIVCGSTTSWMIQKIIYNKGGLHGRLTAEIHLKPFSLEETELYFKAKNIHLDRKQIVEIYLAFGGVAKYLTNVERGKSPAQIIDDTCFSSSGALMTEFPKIFDSLFEEPQNYISVVTALAEKKYGMTQEELQKKTGLSSGGNFSKILKDLENSGFIMPCAEFLHKKKSNKYRLIDEYSLFYLSWIKPAIDNQLNNISKDYWLKMQNNPSYLSWAGYAFEGICLKHVNKITEALKISIIARSYSTWSYIPNKQFKSSTGAQIDLLIDRNDNCINLCEIKFCNGVFNIDKAYAEDLKHKKTCFQQQTETRKSLFLTLITSYGAEINQNYLSSVDNQLTIDALFD